MPKKAKSIKLDKPIKNIHTCRLRNASEKGKAQQTDLTIKLNFKIQAKIQILVLDTKLTQKLFNLIAYTM